jgi:hypothetical protein
MHHIHTFETPGPEDPVRIGPEIWEKRLPYANVVSAHLMVLVGFPVKQVEQYQLGIHRIRFSPGARP